MFVFHINKLTSATVCCRKIAQFFSIQDRFSNFYSTSILSCSLFWYMQKMCKKIQRGCSQGWNCFQTYIVSD